MSLRFFLADFRFISGHSTNRFYLLIRRDSRLREWIIPPSFGVWRRIKLPLLFKLKLGNFQFGTARQVYTHVGKSHSKSSSPPIALFTWSGGSTAKRNSKTRKDLQDLHVPIFHPSLKIRVGALLLSCPRRVASFA